MTNRIVDWITRSEKGREVRVPLFYPWPFWFLRIWAEARYRARFV